MYVVPLALLGAALLAVAGLLNGKGPRVAWALATVCFLAAAVEALLWEVHG